MIRESIEKSVHEALQALGFSIPDYQIEHPNDLSHGDYAVNVALLLAKDAGKNPKEVAESVVEELNKNKPEEIENIEVAGPGFINFSLSREFFTQSVECVLDEGEKWGSNEKLKGKKIMVEHSQPNPFKPFHIGHLMSNAIGESIVRIVKFSGAEVKAVNYQGDVGLHVAKALWGLRDLSLDVRNVEDLGKAYVHGNTQYEESDTAKAEIVELNKKVYAGDPDIAEVYKIGRETSLAHFDELYELLDSKFDHFFFEGETWEKGKELVEEGKEKGIFEESEGAIVFRGEQQGLHTRVFITKEGVPTYEAKDLGLAEAKKDFFPFDISITVTAVEQGEYFKTVFKAYELLRPEQEGKLMHIAHGMMQLSSGKMSSRKGNVVTGESLLRAMQEKARQIGETVENDVVDQVAVAAIKYSILKQAMNKNITFDQEKALSFEGDSGPYLEYTHARACSILGKAEEEKAVEAVPQEVTDVEKLLYRFPEVVNRAREEYEPHYITTYLTQLASAFNSWYAQEKVLDGSGEEGYKLALTKATAQTLKNGLWLLGIKAPQKM